MRKMLMFLVIFVSLFCVSCNKNKVYEYEEKEEIVKTGEYSLKAKMVIPKKKKKSPIVVFVHGSGANDMDESVGALKLFENLANELAKKGIASLRYNKRTYEYLSEVATKIDFTIYDEVIDDAISAVEVCKSYGYQEIYLIGHSFGAQLAPVIANRCNDISGVIMMSGTLEHIIDLGMRQLKNQNSPYYEVYDPYDEYFRDIKEVVKGEEKYFFMGAFEEYWVSYKNINLKEETIMCAKNKKVMITHGEKDLQVEDSALDKYKELLKEFDIKYHLYESLNHMYVDGTNDTLETMYQENQLIPSCVINDISSFIFE